MRAQDVRMRRAMSIRKYAKPAFGAKSLYRCQKSGRVISLPINMRYRCAGLNQWRCNTVGGKENS